MRIANKCILHFKNRTFTSEITHVVVDKSTDSAKTESHWICFLPQYQCQIKCFFFSERDQDRDTP